MSFVSRRLISHQYGGGFEFGGISMYDPTSLVQQSAAMGQPVIVVAANYRVSGFGFMPGKQIQDQQVGNLGLRDQVSCTVQSM